MKFFQTKGTGSTLGVDELQEQYPYLSRRVLLEFDRDLLIRFIPLRHQLRDLVQNQYGNDFTFYFEYLPTGTSIGVNDRTEFYPGSLLKVPIVMAYYYRLENNSIKDETVTIKQEHINSRFGNLYKKGVGSRVKVGDAVKLALTESDNTALNIVRSQITEDDLRHIYDGLDINLRVKSESEIFISVKSYSSILKALFFSSILSRENSNYLLELLSESKFDDKLAAGVPEGVKVAHKIGVYEKPEIPIYSDCGIVYVPRRQYLLCMASKSNEETARKRMKTVSKMVYDYVAHAELSD